MNEISARQFAMFRIVFGIYLTVHFIGLVPYAAELFSREGMLSDAGLNFTSGILPNPLERWDSPCFATSFVAALAGLSVAFSLGYCRRLAALALWFGWACLFNRNNLISNPSLPYVGMLLLLSIIVPAGESFRLRTKHNDWVFPAGVYWTAWTLLAAGYAFSGWTKLQSPSWIDGTALLHVLNNPLARPGFVREAMLQFPDVLQILTWVTLAFELLFLPLSFHRIGRLVGWAALCSLHLCILLFVNFADLSAGMLMVHLFTFDPTWLPAARDDRSSAGISQPRSMKRPLVFVVSAASFRVWSSLPPLLDQLVLFSDTRPIDPAGALGRLRRRLSRLAHHALAGPISVLDWTINAKHRTAVPQCWFDCGMRAE